MSRYTFVNEEDFGTEERRDTQEVHVCFDTDFLDDIVEKFYFFLKSSGFDYITRVTVEKGDDTEPASFSTR